MLSDSRLSQSYTSQALNIDIHSLSYDRVGTRIIPRSTLGMDRLPPRATNWNDEIGRMQSERKKEGMEEEEKKREVGGGEEPTVSNTLRTTVPVSFCDFHVTKNKIVLYSPTGLLYVRRRGPSSGRHHCYYVCNLMNAIKRGRSSSRARI